MCCVELCLFVMGIAALIGGRFEWFGQRVVAGMPARFIGLLLMLPVTVPATLGALRGYQRAQAGQPFRLEAYSDLAVLELLSWAVCLTAAVVIAFLAARPRPGTGRPKFDYKALRAHGGLDARDRMSDDFLPPG
jgi:hypothetical protein